MMVSVAPGYTISIAPNGLKVKIIVVKRMSRDLSSFEIKGLIDKIVGSSIEERMIRPFEGRWHFHRFARHNTGVGVRLDAFPDLPLDPAP